jgi:PAS domain S-box-containing protein
MAKILVVEDENIVAWDIKETLENLGHTVVDLVDSGFEAIDAAVTASPDLVLMDIRLTGAMDGISAADEIYHQFKIPVVYLTAHADELTLERAIKTNPFGYIIKPFQSQSLQSTIKIALQRHQSEVSAYMNQVCLENTLNINSMGSGVIATDRQGLVTFINPIAEQLTGWQASDAIGIEIDRIFRPIWKTDGIRIENPSSRAMRSNEPAQSPDCCWLINKNGMEIPIFDIATPIVKPDGEVFGSILVFRDITDRLRAQMDLLTRNQDLEFFQLKIISQLQVKTAKQQQAISDTLGWLDGLKNEFQNAISDVLGAMQISAAILQDLSRSIDVETENTALVEQHQTLHRKLTTNLQILQAEWERQFQLIDTLIDIQTNGMSERIHSLSDVRFGIWIAGMLKSCTALTQRYHQEIAYRITEQQSLQLLCPFPLLELIVIELFENACKYTPPDRRIRLEVAIRDRQLQFSIISMDTVLSARELELLFLPFAHDEREFAQACRGITGLGLALVNRLVPLFGGKIRATTDLNETITILEVPIPN